MQLHATSSKIQFKVGELCYSDAVVAALGMAMTRLGHGIDTYPVNFLTVNNSFLKAYPQSL